MKNTRVAESTALDAGTTHSDSLRPRHGTPKLEASANDPPIDSLIVPSMADVGMLASSATLERAHHELHHVDTSETPVDAAHCDHRESPTVKEEMWRHKSLLLWYFFAFSCMGMGMAIAGPTLIVLARQIREPNMSTMSFTFMGRAVGFMTGSLFAGRVVDRCGKRAGQLYMSFALYLTALLTFLTSVVPSLPLLILNCFCLAFAMGAVDNIVQILLIALIESEVEPFLQALHSGFAFGSFISPLVVAQFVSDMGSEGSHGSRIDIDVPQSPRYKNSFYLIAGLIIIPATALTILTVRGIGPFQSKAAAPKDIDRDAEAEAERVAGTALPEVTVASSGPSENYDEDRDSFATANPFHASSASRYLRDMERELDDNLETYDSDSQNASNNLNPSTVPAVNIGHVSVQSTGSGTFLGLGKRKPRSKHTSFEDDELIHHSKPTPSSNKLASIELTDISLDSGHRSSTTTVSPSHSLESTSDDASPTTSTDSVDANENPTGFRGNWKVLIASAGFLLFFYVGAETGFGSYLPVYSYKSGLLPESSSSLLNSVFWASFFLGRVLGVPLSRRYTPQQLIRADIILASLALIALVVFHKSVGVLWVSASLFGIFTASLYASVIALVESTVPLTGSVMSVLVFMTCSGEALFPFFMGLSFDLPSGPLSMMFIALAMMAGCGILYAFISYYRTKHMPPERILAEYAAKRGARS